MQRSEQAPADSALVEDDDLRIATTTMYAHMATPKRLAELKKFLE
jgi:hypothetical protein